jgi:hypothetical protein
MSIALDGPSRADQPYNRESQVDVFAQIMFAIILKCSNETTVISRAIGTCSGWKIGSYATALPTWASTRRASPTRHPSQNTSIAIVAPHSETSTHHLAAIYRAQTT